LCAEYSIIIVHTQEKGGMFVSTKDTYSENRKAIIKNHNLPILQHMYMGNKSVELKCVINGSSAFHYQDCYVRKTPVTFFRIDFNHIRQRQSEGRQAGQSVDKGQAGPSEIFRGRWLDRPDYRRDLIEFMTIMPVCTEEHARISQSSAYGDITLLNFDKKYWPWHLQSEDNFNNFVKTWKLNAVENFTYERFIDHLSNIEHPNIRKRIVSGVDRSRPWLSIFV
jgi:hypothetical protein